MCFPDFCFSNRKAYDLYSPENLSGDHRKHRGKCENRGFSPALQMGQFHLKISPKNEKTDRRSGRRRIEKMVGVRGFEPPTFASRTQRSNQAEPHPDLGYRFSCFFYFRTCGMSFNIALLLFFANTISSFF